MLFPICNKHPLTIDCAICSNLESNILLSEVLSINPTSTNIAGDLVSLKTWKLEIFIPLLTNPFLTTSELTLLANCSATPPLAYTCISNPFAISGWYAFLWILIK